MAARDRNGLLARLPAPSATPDSASALDDRGVLDAMRTLPLADQQVPIGNATACRNGAHGVFGRYGQLSSTVFVDSANTGKG